VAFLNMGNPLNVIRGTPPTCSKFQLNDIFWIFFGSSTDYDGKIISQSEIPVKTSPV
jgi:hypothetical protein